MKRLPVEDIGSRATRRYGVKVRGLRVVEELEPCRDRRYAPMPAAAAVTTANRSHKRCFGGDCGGDAEEET